MYQCSIYIVLTKKKVDGPYSFPETQWSKLLLRKVYATFTEQVMTNIFLIKVQMK